MDHEKNYSNQPNGDCNNLEEVKEEVKEVAHEVQEKMEDIKEQAVNYAQKHNIPEKTEAVVEKATEFAKETKEKYDSASPETKAKIKKGVKNSAIALGALMVLKKIFGKKNNHQQ